MNTHLRLLLTGVLALLLFTCTVAAWALPQSQPPRVTSLPAAAKGGPCDMVVGPAHDYCTRAPSPAGPSMPATVADHSAAAAVIRVPAGMDGRVALTLFATAAIGGAVGLVLTVERRMR
ncbi:hypothetical protein [Streptomyces subrutilus]|uniref:Uncharacterized protein n=1 Tax=Streptomyces subrutilus TaxID=36818 RepID=A0A1E5PKA4_9ACTN|nr:hypothetical protein [Streptomyces subrutilus]OEJ30001.1 hypothetical protein BGK67_00085 [Streptomyces subrutilus]